MYFLKIRRNGFRRIGRTPDPDLMTPVMTSWNPPSWKFELTISLEQVVQLTVDRRPSSGRRSRTTAHTDKNIGTVESLLLSREDKPQSHQTVGEISREAGDPSIISFADYSQTSAPQVLQEKARSTADWSAQHARVIFGMQFERR